jgi:hypothetical protein
VKITHLYTGDDGESHFRDLEIPTGEGPNAMLSAVFQTDSYHFMRAFDPPRAEGTFHTAPRRQFVVTLTGVGEIEVGDGTTRRFYPGDIMLADDTTGRGHITRDIEPRARLFISFPEEFDLSQWSAEGGAAR